MTLSQGLARFASETGFDDLPLPVVESVKQRILDTLGIAVAARPTEAASAVRTMAAGWGGAPQATLVGEALRLPTPSAALINGTYAHCLDFDDTHLPSVVHPSATLVPAAVAVGEAHGVDGRALITGLAVGYEACTRLAMAQFDPALRNSVFFEHGLHATSILGTISAAIACAKLQGFDAEGISNAIGVAASFGSGLIEANRSGGSVKKIHCGWAAHGAVLATEAVTHGLTGPPTVLEGRFGFFEAFCRDQWIPDAVLQELGHRWDTPGIFFKPYPCNHFTHALVDAAVEFRRDGLRPEHIRRVRIGAPSACVRTIGEPLELKRRPQTPYQAQFSGPFVFAAALAGGGGLGVSLDDFSEATIADTTKLQVSAVCEVEADAECDAAFPHQFPAVVTVETTSGRQLQQRIMTTRGGPERPLTREEHLIKLRMNTGTRAGALAAAVASLDGAADLGRLVSSWS